MKKTITATLCLACSLAATAQTATMQTAAARKTQFEDIPHIMLRNGWFNHIDIGISGGTSGIGFEVAAPMGSAMRLRTGGVFRPLDNKSARFGLEVAQGLGSNENKKRFDRMADFMYEFTGYKPKSHVVMEGRLGMNNFKFLIDLYPFKKSEEWYSNLYATVGFYWGNGTLIEAKNNAESMNTLTAVALYNTMYRRAQDNKFPLDIASIMDKLGKGEQFDETAIDEALRESIKKFRGWGAINVPTKDETIEYTYWDDVEEETIKSTAQIKRGEFAEYGISIPIGQYAHDVIAPEDIYYDYSDRLYQEADVNEDLPGLSVNPDEFHYNKDANGRYIKKGSLRYKKGEVMHHKGEEFRMVPDADNIVKATARTNKFKPYVGIGYEMPISKNKRNHVAVDAGVMFWGGYASVDVSSPVGMNANGEMVYMTYDMTRDLTGLSGSIKSYVKSVKRYPVFPEISVRLTHRLW